MEKKVEDLKKEYDTFYKDLLKKGKLPLWDTGKGFWGNANLFEVYHAFKKLKLNKHSTFIDLGSGDGKVVLLASLFCKRAVGIEIDPKLVKKSKEVQKKFSITNAIFYNNDFFDHSISEFDFTFVFPDKPMERGLEEKMLKELQGNLIHYGKHFHPKQLRKKKRFSVNGDLFTLYSR